MSHGTVAEGLSTILVNFKENYGNWKISKTVYDFIKQDKVLEPKLLRKIDTRLRKVEKYSEDLISVIFKCFPKKT